MYKLFIYVMLGVLFAAPSYALEATAPFTATDGTVSVSCSSTEYLGVKAGGTAVECLKGVTWDAGEFAGVTYGGTDDDSNGLSAAITAVNAAGGGVIYISGLLDIASQVVLKKNVTLDGRNLKGTLKAKAGGTFTDGMLSAGGTTSAGNNAIVNLNFDLNSIDVERAVHLYGKTDGNFSVIGNKFENGSTTSGVATEYIRLDGGSGNDAPTGFFAVENNTIEGKATNDLNEIGIKITSGAAANYWTGFVSGNLIADVDGTHIHAEHGVVSGNILQATTVPVTAGIVFNYVARDNVLNFNGIAVDVVQGVGIKHNAARSLATNNTVTISGQSAHAFEVSASATDTVTTSNNAVLVGLGQNKVAYYVEGIRATFTGNSSDCESAVVNSGVHYDARNQQVRITSGNLYRCSKGVISTNTTVNTRISSINATNIGSLGIDAHTGWHLYNNVINWMSDNSGTTGGTIGIRVSSTHSIISGNSIHSANAAGYTPIKVVVGSVVPSPQAININDNQLLGRTVSSTNQTGGLIDISTASGDIDTITITGNTFVGNNISSSSAISYNASRLNNITNQQIYGNAVRDIPNLVNSWQTAMGSRSDLNVSNIAVNTFTAGSNTIELTKLKAVYYGDGTDGDLVLDATDETTCEDLDDRSGYDAVLHAECVWSDPTCTCTLKPNSRWGDAHFTSYSFAVGSVYNLNKLQIDANNVLTFFNKTHTQARASGSQAILKVKTTATIAGKIVGNGLGQAGLSYTGNSLTAGTGNAGGCGAFYAYAGTAANANGIGAAGVGYNAQGTAAANCTGATGNAAGYCTSWFFVNTIFDLEPDAVLYGAAGGKGGGGPSVACLDLSGTLPIYSLGAAGGGGGKCTTDMTMNTTPGRGGAGLYLSVGGNYSFTGDINLRGADGTQGGGGGGGGTMMLRVGGTTTASGTYDFSGGDGGAACASGNNTAGAYGGKGALVIL